MLVLSLFLVISTGCSTTPVMTRAELVEQYPSIEEGSTRDENLKIMCPFMRLMERSGFFDEQTKDSDSLTVKTSMVVKGAKTFGCSGFDCGVLSHASAFMQRSGERGIDLESLHNIPMFSHECGFTYEYGASEVSETVRQNTIDRLSVLADEEGNLTFDDIKAVQMAICAEQDVSLSFSGATEAKLLFLYLGGTENGVVALSDVERFFSATVPETITSSKVNLFSTLKIRRNMKRK